MNKTVLATAVCASLFYGTGAWADTPASTPNAADQATPAQGTTDQDQSPPKDKDKKAKTLDAVTVTGSLIPRSEKETASPVIKITGKELQTEGFRNVYDALKTVSISTGATQDSQVASAGSFTPGATTISLFGLDPGFTLILLNGHPMADYPIPYNGTQNVTDLSNVPTEMVDHIDILSGGASSVYGSSAVAGVVNIILKQHVEGFDVDVRGGTYQHGGGDNGRIELTGGDDWGKLSASFALTIDGQAPIRLDQSFWPSRLDNPLGPPVAGRDFLVFEPFSGHYFDPGAAGCDATTGLFGGTEEYSFRQVHGHYCGSMFDYSGATLLNKSQGSNAYLNLTYAIGDNTEAYAEILYGFSKQSIGDGTKFYSYQNPDLSQSANSFSGVFWDPVRHNFESIQRIFAPEETGGLDKETILTRQYNVNIGIKGGLFGSSTWDYDAYYNRSQINTDDNELWPLTQPFNDYYLGQQQGIGPYGFPVFTPNYDNIYKPITSGQFLSMSDWIHSQSVSWEQSAHITLTDTELFNTAGGPAGIALIAETGNQAFNNPVDQGLIDGLFNNRTGTQGSGSRSRFAFGGEMRVPLGTKKLIADLSARYDSYSFAGRTDAKPTYKIGLEFRPIDSLLFRGNYATAFRAPDMDYIFQGNSGFYTGGNDYYLCRLQGFDQNDLSDCPQANESLFSFYHGSPDLKDITAKTFSFGLVWSPTEHWDIQADYNNIQISNEVETLDPDKLLELEANCRLGTSFGGQTFDINSPECQQALAQVHRFPFDDPFQLAAGQIENVSTFPINVAKESLDGIQASTSYHHDIGRFGDIVLHADYYVELNHKQQLNPGDPVIDLLHNFNSYEFKSRTSGSATWNVGKWSTTVFGTLYGKTVNAAGTGITGRWAQFNWSLQYSPDPTSYFSATVNNIANRAPPTDATYAGSNAVQGPYYNASVYNGYGIAYWLEYNKHF